MSKLLIDDNPLQVLPKLAEAIGLNEAIVIQQLHYWLNKSENIHEGQKWVYNTYQEWKESNFPFWSVQTIGNVFRSLEERGLIISKQINVKNWDRKKWYTIEYDELERIENQIIERLNIVSSIEPKLDTLHNTETTTETNPMFSEEANQKVKEIESMVFYVEEILNTSDIDLGGNGKWYKAIQYLINVEKERGWDIKTMWSYLNSEALQYKKDIPSIGTIMKNPDTVFKSWMPLAHQVKTESTHSEPDEGGGTYV